MKMPSKISINRCEHCDIIFVCRRYRHEISYGDQDAPGVTWSGNERSSGTQR